MTSPVKKTPPPVGGRLSTRDEDNPDRPKRTFSRNDTFGLKFDHDIQVNGFGERGEHTPDIDDGYIFPEEATRVVLWGMQNGDRILATGHTGTGKSALFEQIGARLNFNVFKLNFDSHISRADLVGEYVVVNSSMKFIYGILPTAMRTPGSIIILDEWDTISDDTSFVIQRLLQKEDGRLLIMENGGEIVKLRNGNVVVATANTVGQGDETGLYSHGTRHQNYAQLNRFGLTIRCEYLPPEQEKNMLLKRFDSTNPQEKMKDHEATAFVKTINKIREGFTNGTVSVPLSTRDLINWVEKYIYIGNPMIAATYCFLNRMNVVDSETCRGIIQRAFSEE